MQGSIKDNASKNYIAIHSLDPQDAPVADAMRNMVSSSKGAQPGPEARGQFDALMERVSPRSGVAFEEGVVGGVSGFWVHPQGARAGEAILHLHGGWFNFGSAKAYRNLVAHIAARAGAKAFIPDYRLAPEFPFPAATEDVFACYKALAKDDVRRIAITGDSAGGNLTLGLASRVTNEAASATAALVGVVVLSPVTDLTLSGESYETRAEADPLFTRPVVAGLLKRYLDGADPKQSLASPLFGQHAGMPPIRVHVGDNEVLLDDSIRFVKHAVAAGVDARAEVWMGMPHGFPASVGRFKAAELSLDDIGAFLTARLQGRDSPV